MKKLLSLTLCLVLTACALTGCGKDASEEKNGEAEKTIIYKIYI